MLRTLRKLTEIGLYFGIMVRRIDQRFSKNYYKHDLSCQIPNISDLQTKYLGKIHNGTFIEIGSFDGKEFGFVWGLANKGWQGILVEPIPENVIRIRKNYKNHKKVKILEVAVSNKKSKIYIYEDKQLSTSIKSKNNKKAKKYKVNTLRLEDICLENKVPVGFDFLSIDVEGIEEEVIENFNFKKWMPKMVVIELTDTKLKSENAKSHQRIMVKMVDKFKYKVVYKDWINTVFIRKDIYAKR